MNQDPGHPDILLLERLGERALSLGVAIALFSDDGDIVGLIGANADRLRTALSAQPSTIRAMRQALAQAESGVAFPCADFGHVVALRPGTRRRRTGGLLALMANPEFRDRSGFDPSPTPWESSLDVSLLASVLQSWHRDLTQIVEQDHILASCSEQLCDTYEEVNLLYRIGNVMNVVQRPRRFISTVCEELHEVMSYRWVGVRLLESRSVCEHLRNTFFCVGDLDCNQYHIERAATKLIEHLKPGKPLVISDTETECGFEDVALLGKTLIARPLNKGDQVFGVVIASDKGGDGSEIVASDLKLLDATASHIRIFLDNAALYEEMNRMFMGTLEALSASIDAKDPYTCGHSQRVALLSRQLAHAVELDAATVDRIHIAGLVHDVGKIGVPEAVLCKAGRLTDAEFDEIKKHPEIGARILKDIPHFDDIIPGVLHHHERYDGRGYPYGLGGEGIPLFGRIIAIADTFDAMSSTRTYRTARPRSDVIKEIERCAGSQFDPAFARAFIELDFSRFDEMFDLHQASGLENRGEAA